MNDPGRGIVSGRTFPIRRTSDMSDGKFPMPASGQDSPKLRSDGVSDVDSNRRGPGGESGGGSYDNPHTGKEARGESEGFDGGQSGRDYHGPGQLGGHKADPDEDGAVGQGGNHPGDVAERPGSVVPPPTESG